MWQRLPVATVDINQNSSKSTPQYVAPCNFFVKLDTVYDKPTLYFGIQFFDWIFKWTPDILPACGGVIHLKYTGCFLSG